MAKITLNITEDHLKLIQSLKMYQFNDSVYGVDNYQLFGDYMYENMALILGFEDKVIPETKEDYLGAKYPQEYMEKMDELYAFFVDNLPYIYDLLLQFSCKGGLKIGKYTARDYQRIWTYLGE